MSRDLLADVLRTADARERARRCYVLPLSIAAHAVAAIVIFIIPLLADVERPEPVQMSHPYTHMMPAVVPDVPLPKGDPQPSATRDAAPKDAPSTIEPEAETPIVRGSPADPPTLGQPGAPDGVDFGLIGNRTVVVTLPPEPPRPPEPVRVGSLIKQPRKIVHAEPVYPQLAIAAQKEGVVILEAVIDERGHVVRLKVLRSEPLLDAAAIAAVERWRYTPTLLNNVPVPVLMTITVRFTMR